MGGGVVGRKSVFVIVEPAADCWVANSRSNRTEESECWQKRSVFVAHHFQ